MKYLSRDHCPGSHPIALPTNPRSSPPASAARGAGCDRPIRSSRGLHERLEQGRVDADRPRGLTIPEPGAGTWSPPRSTRSVSEQAAADIRHQHEAEAADGSVDGVVGDRCARRPALDARRFGGRARCSGDGPRPSPGRGRSRSRRPPSPTSTATSKPVSPGPAASSRTVSPGRGASSSDRPFAHRCRGRLDLGPPALPPGRHCLQVSQVSRLTSSPRSRDRRARCDHPCEGIEPLGCGFDLEGRYEDRPGAQPPAPRFSEIHPARVAPFHRPTKTRKETARGRVAAPPAREQVGARPAP